jgi:hypothetical protein
VREREKEKKSNIEKESKIGKESKRKRDYSQWKLVLAQQIVIFITGRN